MPEDTRAARVASYALLKDQFDTAVDHLDAVVSSRFAERDVRFNLRAEAQDERADLRFDAVDRIASERDERYQQRFDAHEKATTEKAQDVAEKLDERDLRFEQRFTAQQTATTLRDEQLALEFHEHLQQVREENKLSLNSQENGVNKAFDASDRAIEKANAATEKRFDAVNGFQRTINDLTSQMMPRAEAVARDDINAGRIAELTLVSQTHTTYADMDSNTRRLEGRLEDMKTRLDAGEGKDKGVSASFGVVMAIVGPLIAVVSIAASIIIATR